MRRGWTRYFFMNLDILADFDSERDERLRSFGPSASSPSMLRVSLFVVSSRKLLVVKTNKRRRCFTHKTSSLSPKGRKKRSTKASETFSRDSGCHLGFLSLSTNTARTPSKKSLEEVCQAEKTKLALTGGVVFVCYHEGLRHPEFHLEAFRKILLLPFMELPEDNFQTRGRHLLQKGSCVLGPFRGLLLERYDNVLHTRNRFWEAFPYSVLVLQEIAFWCY